MKIAITITAYDRPDLLEQCFENLFITYPCGADAVVVVVDGPNDPRVMEVVNKYRAHWPVHCVHHFEKNQGIAEATNYSLAEAFNLDVDYAVHCDSDTFIKRANWCRELCTFMKVCPEVGLGAPDLPGRYMRLSHKQAAYDEIEYALGMVWAVRREVYNKVTAFLGNGFFDRDIHHQFDPDICYRIRTLGYRVGITDIGELVDLGVGSGDSSKLATKESNALRGGFEFLKKWNTRFVGPHFHYKSPMCLRWDNFPLNYLWRKMWLTQFPVNEVERIRVLQGHTFNMVEFPDTPDRWMLEETKTSIEQDLVFYPGVPYSAVDLDLLTGKRKWRPEDAHETSWGNDS